MKVHDKEHTGKNLADLAAQVFNKQVDTAVITSIPAQEGSGLVNHSPPPSSKKEALEQKPDVELRKKLESEFNTFRNSVYTTESSAPILNDFLWFFDKYTALQSENQRLTSDVETQERTIYSLRGSLRTANKNIEDLTKINEELVKGLTDAIERMGRALAILTEREGQPDCWQMLNADNLKSILNP